MFIVFVAVGAVSVSNRSCSKAASVNVPAVRSVIASSVELLFEQATSPVVVVPPICVIEPALFFSKWMIPAAVQVPLQ